MIIGMPNLLFTVLQHIIEDPAQLTQSMESTVKVCWLRLSKQKTSKVTFKSLIEILAPLIHRDQHTFVQVIRTNVRLYRSDGLLYTALKDSAQRSEEAAKSATVDASKTTGSQDAQCSEEPIVEEKTKDNEKKDVDKEKKDVDKEKDKEKEKDVETEQEIVKDEKNKCVTVSTPKPAASSSSASSAKRQKTPQGYNSIPASTYTGVTLGSSSASASSAAVGMKTPSRSAVKDKKKKTIDVGTPHPSPAPATTAQAVIEELLGLAVSQWSRQQAIANHYVATYGNGSKGEDGKPVKADPSSSSSCLFLPLAPCHLTIAEIMLVVGDLVSIVPGLATCVHR